MDQNQQAGWILCLPRFAWCSAPRGSGTAYSGHRFGGGRKAFSPYILQSRLGDYMPLSMGFASRVGGVKGSQENPSREG